MMKLLASNPWCGHAISRVLGALLYSTEALASSIISSSPPFQSLYRRILLVGNRNPRVSVVPMLDQWVKEGRELKQPEIKDFIKQLRKSRRHSQALEVSEWMSDVMKHDLSPGGIAVRLDLISKVRGLQQAEKYFDSIPYPFRGVQLYGSLLYCYTCHKSVEKAEITFGKMKELGFAKGFWDYNAMLSLYFRTGEYEKLHVLVEEMEEKNIGYDIHTLKLRMLSYSATGDIDQMEKLLVKMEADPLVTMDWHGYFVAAKAFSKAGLLEKTSTLLRRSEQLIDNDTRKIGYEHLMISYAAIGNKDEVYRIWDLHKNTVGFYNNGYRCVVSSLMKLGDIDGAEKIVQEWESGVKFYDIGIPNLLVTAYCRQGLFEKAKSYVEKLMESGEGNASTLLVLATGYHMNGHMEKAVEAMKNAAKMSSRSGRKFNDSTLDACLKYLKEKGDTKSAHEILRLLRKKGYLPTGSCDKLENYVDGGQPQV
ncbi:pentatricopeptide repeat-containing protein At2g20710, mitochondrial-like [Prunus avium]|uniref:Pentatricopeptide repeat-containing protein At2g20710, mitochondrial-like n=1 Tax=Prunus avium TaxID=42229 RepID=A0A6P5RWC9_PRUAV|nr:pentatricopeptide repeat-containing protein At2g20710, mitochondrial-like [Prunus avium]